MDPRFTPRLVNARSRLPFPNLNGPSCPWHTKCTPMDCENFNRLPSTQQSLDRINPPRGKHSR